SAPGNGTLTLTATGTNASDAGYYTVQVMTFVPSTVSGGVFTKDSHYLLQETANAYDSWGRITQLADARSKVTNYTYGPDPATRRSLVHTEYVDGLGRPIQSVERETDTRFLVAATQYDAMGRIWRQWKPYPGAAVTYDANFATNAASYYNAYHGTTDIKAYVETQYTPDALARAKQVIPAYAG